MGDPTSPEPMSKMIDEQLVRHIGKLSRIELSDEEVATFQRQFSEVLAAFDKLQQLDTENVEPMAHAIDLHNVLADDEPAESLSTQAALANAPQQDENLFQVPKVLGDGS